MSGAKHTHTWDRDTGTCACGQPVPGWLRAAWDRYAANNQETDQQ